MRERKRGLKEAEDRKLQKMAYEFFQYLAARDLPPGSDVLEYNETVRQAHAARYRDGVQEFLGALADYTSGYARGMLQDERQRKANYYAGWFTTIRDVLSRAIKAM